MPQTSRPWLPVVVCLSALIGDAATGLASAQSLSPNIRTLTLSLCNKTGKLIDSILVHRSSYGEDYWILRGWWTLQPNKCISILGIPRGYFYYYAEERGGQGAIWAGSARRVCIQNRVVERAIFPKEKCLFGEKNVGFREVHSIDEKVELPLFVKP